MKDIDKLLYILDTLKIKHSTCFRPKEKISVQICDHDTRVIGTIWFDAKGKFEYCESSNN